MFKGILHGNSVDNCGYTNILAIPGIKQAGFFVCVTLSFCTTQSDHMPRHSMLQILSYISGFLSEYYYLQIN